MNKTFITLAAWAAWACLPLQAAVEPAWDILDKDMTTWNADDGAETNRAWKTTKSYIAAEQAEGYVHLSKTGGADGFITPTACPATPKDTYTLDIRLRVNAPTLPDSDEGFEANQITAAVAGKKMKIYLRHGGGNGSDGYLCYTPAQQHDADEKVPLDLAGWHVYRFVYFPDDYTYDLYVDDLDHPIATGIKTHYDGSKSYVMLGADKGHYADMDVAYVRMGTGNFSRRPAITALQPGSDSHVEGNPRTVTLNATTDLLPDGTLLQAALFDEAGETCTEPVEATVTQNTATASLALPATLSKGRYTLRLYAPGDRVDGTEVLPFEVPYFIVEPSPLELGLLPEVTPVGFVIDIEDYQIPSPTNEYIFPVVIDTKKHLDAEGHFANGSKPLDRYYWYHTPHNDPGGMYLYTAPTLDGPWTERGVRASLEWAKEAGLNTPHISSCHIVWNDVYGKYFMYFHGGNDQTNYATSDDLWDWTFGGKLVQYDDFCFSAREASYAKVFEHEVPGYGNKYIMLLMINENNSRTIYWAHSADGIDWKCVRTPLVTPKTAYKKIPGTDTKPNYASNVSAPYFMEAGGRYFVLFHSSAGNISVVEVGERLDMEVHWGTYLNHQDVVITEDEAGNPAAVSRVASPFFIQDDLGTWYMFFEAGHRLGSNTAYAKGQTPVSTGIAPQTDNTLFTASRHEDMCKIHNPLGIVCPYAMYSLSGTVLQRGRLQPGDNLLPAPQGMTLLRIVTDKQAYTLKVL